MPYSQEMHYSGDLWALTVPGPRKPASTLSCSEHCTSEVMGEGEGGGEEKNETFGKCSKNEFFSHVSQISSHKVGEVFTEQVQ